MPSATWSVVFSGLLLGVAAGASSAADDPRRIQNGLALPEGFSIGLVHGSRFESLTDSVHSGASRDDSMIIMRTLLDTRYRRGGVEAQFELVDSRQQLADDDAFVTQTAINALEVLQATLSFDLTRDGNIRLGRFATDWGSRRFLARNRFRNGINNFEGFEWVQPLANGATVRLLGAQVVRRLPADRIGLLDNERVYDESSGAQRFYAANLSLPPSSAPFDTNLYFFSLQEKDSPGVRTRNRRIHSAGLSLRKPPVSGEFDFEFESLLQFGHSRASSSAAHQTDLDHRSFFQYAAVGYSFPNSLRAVLEIDYGSGDEDPDDLDNQRFDSLFGVTTMEFGAVGIYQPFSRSNLITPGIRLVSTPRPDLNIMVSWRHFWLEEARDSWGRTRRRDVTGESGSYLGQHLEFRIRWDVIPGNLRIDTGAIMLNAEGLSNNNTRYGYTGVVFTF